MKCHQWQQLLLLSGVPAPGGPPSGCPGVTCHLGCGSGVPGLSLIYLIPCCPQLSPLADLCSPYLVWSVPQLSALLLFVHTCHLGSHPQMAQPLTYADGFLCPHPSLFPDLRLTLRLSSVVCPSHLSLGGMSHLTWPKLDSGSSSPARPAPKFTTIHPNAMAHILDSFIPLFLVFPHLVLSQKPSEQPSKYVPSLIVSLHTC